MRKYLIIVILVFIPITSRAQDSLRSEKLIPGGFTVGVGIPSGLSFFGYRQLTGNVYAEAGLGYLVAWCSVNAGIKVFINSENLLGFRYTSLIVLLAEDHRSFSFLSLWFGGAGRTVGSSAFFWGLGLMIGMFTPGYVLPFAEIGFRL